MYTIHINTNTILIGIHNGLKIHTQLHVATTPTPANLRVRNIKHNIVPIPNPLLFLFSAMSLYLNLNSSNSASTSANAVPTSSSCWKISQYSIFSLNARIFASKAFISLFMTLSYLVQRILMLLLLTQPGKPFARTAPV